MYYYLGSIFCIGNILTFIIIIFCYIIEELQGNKRVFGYGGISLWRSIETSSHFQAQWFNSNQKWLSWFVNNYIEIKDHVIRCSKVIIKEHFLYLDMLRMCQWKAPNCNFCIKTFHCVIEHNFFFLLWRKFFARLWKYLGIYHILISNFFFK